MRIINPTALVYFTKIDFQWKRVSWKLYHETKILLGLFVLHAQGLLKVNI